MLQLTNIILLSQYLSMQIVVVADGVTQKEFQDKLIPEGIVVQFVATVGEASKGAGAYFYLREEEDLVKDREIIKSLGAPTFVHAVSTTLHDLPDNCIRICGWRGFLLQETIEISATRNNIEGASEILNTLHWRYQEVPDILGLIAPRTTALLINEAYLILQNDASQKQQIDSAIKLAANFTSGPFELAEKIGVQKVFNLLVHLAVLDMRYNPAPSLKNEISDLGAAS